MNSETLERARRGDPAAQEAIVVALTPKLLGVAYRLGCDDAVAEELVEEALYRGIVKLRELRRDDALVSWFCRIVANLWRDRMRRRRRSSLALEEIVEPPASQEFDPVARAEEGELREELARAVASLPPAQRAVITLHVDAQLSPGEIAAVLESTVDRVKANLYHARRRLQILLARRDGPMDDS